MKDLQPQLGLEDMLVSGRVLHAQQDQGVALLYEPHLRLILLFRYYCIPEDEGIMYE